MGILQGQNNIAKSVSSSNNSFLYQSSVKIFKMTTSDGLIGAKDNAHCLEWHTSSGGLGQDIQRKESNPELKDWRQAERIIWNLDSVQQRLIFQSFVEECKEKKHESMKSKDKWKN